MLSTVLGMVIEVSPVHFANADTPMLVMLAGMVIEVSPERPENADASMLVTLPSVGIVLVLQPTTRVFVAVLMMQFSALWYALLSLATVTEVSPEQPENADASMLVTLAEIVIEVSPVQPENAKLPMCML